MVHIRFSVLVLSIVTWNTSAQTTTVTQTHKQPSQSAPAHRANDAPPGSLPFGKSIARMETDLVSG
jgi:hypothetical protein